MYFDNAATTRVSDRVVGAMLPYMYGNYGNASSIHSMGRKSNRAVEKSRLGIASYLHVVPENIIFTSGGSEANALAIRGVMGYLLSIGKTHAITTAIEHPSVLENFKYLESAGFEVTRLMPDSSGHISDEQLKVALKRNTGLVSVMAVNNEIGVVQDISRISRVCKEFGVLFHSDFVQAFGCITPLAPDIMDRIDFLSISGHKIHAAKGVGFLYVKNKDIISPLILGGGQEYGIRSGTENVPGIVGLAEAIKELQEDNNIGEVKREFVTRIKELFGHSNKDAIFNGLSDVASDKIVNIRFSGIDGQTLVLMLNNKDIYVSAGSACSSQSSYPSHVLKAIGLTDEEAMSSIRISFSKYNTVEEARNAAQIIYESVMSLRQMEF